jgi:DNA repair protein SbcC/Rad50
MTRITLKKIIIVNFKGIRDRVIEFGKITDITGANASGKTTVVDAFRWGLFGKDSGDRADFELQPLDESGRIIPKVETEVTIVLDIDFKETTFKRVYREKWVKKRGEKEPTKEGNENLFFWNDVPMREVDYKVKVNGVVSESIFKLVTNPHYFNSIKWQDRRATLIEMCGAIDEKAIAAGNPKYLALLQELQTKTEKEYKSQIAAGKKKTKDALEQIPHRIDEARRAIPDVLNWVELLTGLAEKEAQLAEIDNSLLNESQAINVANTEQRNKQTSLHNLQTKANSIEYTVRQEIANKRQLREGAIQDEKRKLRSLNDQVSGNTSDLLASSRRIELLTAEQAQLRAQWTETNGKKFEFDDSELERLRDEWIKEEAAIFPGIADDDCACPTCKRAFDAADIDAKRLELENNFNDRKAETLASLAQKANAIKAEKEKQSQQFTDNNAKQLQALQLRGEEITNELNALAVKKDNLVKDNASLSGSINTANKLIAELEAENNRLNAAEAQQLTDDLAANAEYQNLLVQIENLKANDSPQDLTQAMATLKSKKQVLVGEIDAIKKDLGKEEQIKAGHKRIAELEAEERSLAQQLAEFEGIEFTMLQFEKAKMLEVENRINSLFKYARFKMFDQQLNGGENACCETTYLGVPFSDLNTASKMKVGIDIINALSKHYEVIAPIFLDNRESVTEIPDTDAQVINLKVSPSDKTLRIEQHAEAVA